MRPRARRQTKAAAPVDIESQAASRDATARRKKKELQHVNAKERKKIYELEKRLQLRQATPAITIGCNLKGEAGAKEFVYFRSGTQTRGPRGGDRQTYRQTDK